MTLAAVAASASIAMGATTETRNYHNTVKEMTETFCEYARINSQSKYPESGAGEFTMTPGQGRMAEKLVEDIRKAEKKYGMQGIKLTRRPTITSTSPYLPPTGARRYRPSASAVTLTSPPRWTSETDQSCR